MNILYIFLNATLFTFKKWGMHRVKTSTNVLCEKSDQKTSHQISEAIWTRIFALKFLYSVTCVSLYNLHWFFWQ